MNLPNKNLRFRWGNQKIHIRHFRNREATLCGVKLASCLENDSNYEDISDTLVCQRCLQQLPIFRPAVHTRPMQVMVMWTDLTWDTEWIYISDSTPETPYDEESAAREKYFQTYHRGPIDEDTVLARIVDIRRYTYDGKPWNATKH